MSRVRTVVATELLMLLGLLALVGAAYLAERGLSLDAPLRLSPVSAAVLAAVPALLWLGYFYAQDRHEPEARRHVLGVALLGAFVAAPIAEFVTDMARTPSAASPVDLSPLSASSLVAAIAIVGIAQELCKYAVVRYTVYSSPELGEPLDAIVYMTAAAIGFATYENYQALGALRGEVQLSAGVALTAVTTLAHASFAAVLGLAAAAAKFRAVTPTMRGAMLTAGVLLAAVLNGQYRVIENAVTGSGFETHPWHGVAYTFGFAAAVFLVVAVLMRRLLLATAERPA